jgi:hypothetical protein
VSGTFVAAAAKLFSLADDVASLGSDVAPQAAKSKANAASTGHVRQLPLMLRSRFDASTKKCPPQATGSPANSPSQDLSQAFYSAKAFLANKFG